MALYLDVGPDDMVRIGSTVVTIERKSGARARLRIIGTDEVELTKRLAVSTVPVPPLRMTPAVATGD